MPYRAAIILANKVTTIIAVTLNQLEDDNTKKNNRSKTANDNHKNCVSENHLVVMIVTIEAITVIIVSIKMSAL